MVKILTLIASGLAVLATAGPAAAAVVTYNFTATQTSATGAPPPGSLTAQAFGLSILTGTISYDTSAVDADSDPNIGSFSTGLILLDQLPGATASATSSLNIANDFGGAWDGFFLGADLTSGDRIRFDLMDLDQTAFSSDALPAMLALSLFENTQLRFLNSIGASQAVFQLTALTPAEIPLPAAFPLFLAGLAGLGLARRGRMVGRFGKTNPPGTAGCCK